MKTLMLVTVLVVCGHISVALALCEPSATLQIPPLSPEKLALRQSTFQAYCSKSEIPLVDGNALENKGKIKYSNKRVEANVTVTPDVGALIQTAKHPVIMAYIVEPYGKVLVEAVLESSGNSELDDIARHMVSTWDFGRVKMDGKPVRVFMTSAVLGRLMP